MGSDEHVARVDDGYSDEGDAYFDESYEDVFDKAVYGRGTDGVVDGEVSRWICTCAGTSVTSYDWRWVVALSSYNTRQYNIRKNKHRQNTCPYSPRM